MPEVRDDHPITLVLPSWMVSIYSDLFDLLGFGSVVVCPDLSFATADELERVEMAENRVALEWQSRKDGHHMLELMKTLGIDCPVLLFQNFEQCSDAKAKAMGYTGVIPLGKQMEMGELGGPVMSPVPSVKVLSMTIQDAFLDFNSSRQDS